uniref:proteinase-activated receptor 3 isoform X2 n=1 Tax=Scatophagus argus TaxID=75038 RepID=UPI001ED838D8|nr:proteinase-activated receptor 3 isoform X2 [Scatophagus argus]
MRSDSSREERLLPATPQSIVGAERGTMGRRLLFFLGFVLCLGASLQTEERRGTERRRNGSKGSGPVPRTFKGDPVTEADLFQGPNGTEAPISPHSPPLLRLRSNSTARFLRGPLSTRVIPIIYMLAVTVGIPANVAILCTLATKVRKVSSAILYCSLAVSDLLLLLSLFFKAHYHLHGNHWLLGEAACRVVTACFYGNLYCSAQTLACISTKRYLAVVHPFTYKSMPKRTCTAWASVAVWVVFGAAVVPELLVQQSYRSPELNITTCHDVLPLDEGSHAFLLSYNLCLTVVGLLVPLLVTVVCYGRIVRELSQSHHDWAMYIKASSLVLVIFLLCFTPAGLLHLVHHVQLFEDKGETLYVYYKVAVCLCCVHACLDPFLFLFMSRTAGSRLYFRPFKGKSLSISF